MTKSLNHTKPAKHKLLILAWIVVLMMAIFWQFWSARPKPVPPGWKTWRHLGSILAIAMTRDGVVVGGAKGLYRIDAQYRAKPVAIKGITNPVMVYSLVYDRNGRLWVGHDNGLSCLDGSGWKTFTEADGLPDRIVKALKETRAGELWIGTNNGAIRLSGSSPRPVTSAPVLTSPNGLLHSLVFAIGEDREGGIWFGNYAAPDGGLNRLQDGRWQHWTPKEGLPHANVTSLMLDGEGRIWAGCGFMDRGGAAIFSGKNGAWHIDKILPPDELAGIKVRSLFQDSRGRVWIGSENDGMAIRYGDKTIKILTTENGLANQEVLVTAEAPDGAIWMGTISGLNRISPEATAALFPQQQRIVR